MKKIHVLLSAILLSAVFSYSGFAQQTTSNAPRTISYQGLLLDNAKHPVIGSHHITIRLYDAPLEGVMLHSENFISEIANGVFSIIIGSEQQIEPAILFDKEYWVGVSVDDAGELTPRTKLTSVPYAVHSDIASSLAKGASGAVTSMNGRTGNLTIKGGIGTTVESDGNTITITSLQSGAHGNEQVAVTTVNSVTGTTNQITANPTTGNVVLSLPQNIHSSATPTFAGLTLSNFNTSGIIHNNTSGALSSSLVSNADVANNAAIAYSKLNLVGSIGNNDVVAGANIAYSKLNLIGSISNTDVANNASIAYNKLNLIGSISNNDVAANANISASKINLVNGIVTGDIVNGTIVNADINNNASIAYTKLNLVGSISNNEVAANANISANKINLVNGIVSGDIVNGTIINADVNAAAAIAYSKLNLGASIINSDIAGGAAIADSKLATLSTAGKVANSATTASSNSTANTIVLRDASGNFNAGIITASLNGNATNLSGTVSETHGGTNQTTYTKGDILYASGANTLSKLSIGALGQVITVSGGVPAWAALSGVGVTSLAGTTNQILVNGGTTAQTGGITLSLPQNINNGASPTFAGMTLSGMSTIGVVHNNASGVLASTLIIDADIAPTAAIADSKLAIISTSGKIANSATTATSTNTNNAIIARDASGNFSAGTITANLTGNVTGNVIGNITGTITGNATGTSANVTGVVSEIHGGTNQSVYSTGDMLYASSATTLARQSIGTNGQVLTVSAGIPVWSTVAANVASVIGTANEILVNGDGLSHSGVITLTTPQAIGTNSSPIFVNLSLMGKATSASTANGDKPSTLTTKDYVDNIASEYWNIGGNTGLNSSTNYFGTNDATDLVLKTNSVEGFRLTSGGSLLLNGTSGIIPTGGSGTRMMWIPSLGAFRAGGVDGSEWNSVGGLGQIYVGQYSAAMGYSTTADGNYAIALGYYTSADGIAAVALGTATTAFGNGSTAMGSASQASGDNSVAMGDNTSSSGTGSVAMGSNTIANGLFSTAMGSQTTANGDLSVVMGSHIKVGTSSFGYNSGSNNSIVDITGMSGVAYFGDANVIIGNDDNAARSLMFYGSNNTADLSGGFYSSFTAGTQSANIAYTLPVLQGTANSLMTNDGTGKMNWSKLSDLNILAGSALHYDATNNRLGIGTSTPAQVLDVTGNANVSGSITSGSTVTTNGLAMSGGTAVLSYSTITAGATIAIPNNAVVKITDDAANAANKVTMPTGTNGQIIYIYNNDAQTTSGDITLANGAMGVYIYVDGWRKAN